jgi:hypothetical protein
MATIEDFQWFIDWCDGRPAPSDGPNLVHVLQTQVVTTTDERGVIFVEDWVGQIRHRGGQSRSPGGVFAGVLAPVPSPNVFYPQRNEPLNYALLIIDFVDDEARARLEGPFVPPELQDDLSIDVFENEYFAARLGGSLTMFMWLFPSAQAKQQRHGLIS